MEPSDHCIIRRDGTKLPLVGISVDQTWEDVFDLLYENELIAAEEYLHAQASERFYQTVSGVFNLNTNDAAPSTSTPTNEIRWSRETASNTAPPSSDGIQTGTVSVIDWTSGPAASSTSASSPVEKAAPILFGKIRHDEAPPPARAPIQGDFYTMQGVCAAKGHAWWATLKSDQKPAKHASSEKKNPAGVRIHLLLDDSTSMRKNDAQAHLKSALNGFLKGRSKADLVSISTLNNTVSLNLASPSEANAAMQQHYKTRGSTPFRQGFNFVLQKAIRSGDVVILFTDGAPDEKPAEVPSIVAPLKSKGCRLCAVGCGKARKDILDAVASTPADVFFADKVEDLTATFEAVAKSIRQTTTVHSKDGGSSGLGHAFFLRGELMKGGSTDAPENSGKALPDGYGFGRIDGFECPGCRSRLRVVCGACGTCSCDGGVTTSGGTQEVFRCPSCATESLLESKDDAHTSVSMGGRKK